jgi:xanthine/CO dehydrogenase XdhC/CoxF family maturation factor
LIHELKEIIHQAAINQKKGLKNVLASVVHLEGSSYRKPGVRMLISEDLTSVGAVSGGCVEKEIIQRAKTVFRDNKPKIITYDGRYRLGCEGILYILIEPITISEEFLTTFTKAYSKRESLKIESNFTLEDECFGDFGSMITFENQKQFSFIKSFIPEKNTQLLSQILQPAFKLVIIGGEHDAVQLCKIAANLGWEIEVITSAKDSKQLSDFPGASKVLGESPETIEFKDIKENCAIVLMNHSYVQDLKYLVKLSEKNCSNYIGILGAPKRRERLFNELFEFAPETTEAFLETIYTPAGLHIGAKTPQEIAISIIAEILAVTRNKEPFSLRNITGKIHSN